MSVFGEMQKFTIVELTLDQSSQSSQVGTAAQADASEESKNEITADSTAASQADTNTIVVVPVVSETTQITCLAAGLEEIKYG